MRFFCVVLFCAVVCARAGAQVVAPEVQEAGDRVAERLRAEGKSLVPEGAEIWVRAQDGRIYAWSVSLPDGTDYEALAKEAGNSDDDGRLILIAWAERLQTRLIGLTTDGVKAAGSDPEFNPETDVRLHVCARAPRTLTAGALRAFYSVAFTGSRRRAVTCENGEIVREASGEPRGGEITVAFAPDRAGWKPGEAVTGRLTVTNTGTSRVPLAGLWGDRFVATDSRGKAAEPIFFSG